MPKKGRASRKTSRAASRSSQAKGSSVSKTKRKQLVAKGQKKVKVLGQKIKAKGIALSRKSKYNFIKVMPIEYKRALNEMKENKTKETV